MRVLVLCALLLAAFGLAEASTHTLFHRSVVPSGWEQGPRASGESAVQFTIALVQRNLDILDKWFTEVSDPRHRNYQAFKSIDELNDLVSPKPDDVEKVLVWLYSNGVHHRSVRHLGDAIEVDTKVKHAERLFNTKFFSFRHSETGAELVRSFGAYSVPASLKAHIEMVTGVSTFPVPHLRVQRNVSNDYGVIPATIDKLYDITSEAREMLRSANAAGKTSQSVIEFQGESFAPSDLADFARGLKLTIDPLTAAHIVGPNDATNPGTEAELDIQMVAGVNRESTNWFWLENGNGWLYQFALHFFQTNDVPQVASLSYGWWEGDQCTISPDECQQLGVDSVGYVKRVNTEFQKIGLRGVSLLVSSGDSGANGRTDSDCTQPQLRPAFPASSPYVTAVGATELVDTTPLASPPPICNSAGLTCVAGGKEQAVSYAISQFASGGGFSAIADQPAYQADAVKAYFASGVQLPPSSYYNKTGRGFPDVAAVGHNLIIVAGDQPQPVGGTSASAPIFAAVVAMLNAVQIEKTGKPLGFINPLLYQMHAADASLFTDVTVGDNKCTEDGCSSSCYGYMCAKGWDPVTGLGSPVVSKMLAYVKSGAHMQHKRA